MPKRRTVTRQISKSEKFNGGQASSVHCSNFPGDGTECPTRLTLAPSLQQHYRIYGYSSEPRTFSIHILRDSCSNLYIILFDLLQNLNLYLKLRSTNSFHL